MAGMSRPETTGLTPRVAARFCGLDPCMVNRLQHAATGVARPRMPMIDSRRGQAGTTPRPLGVPPAPARLFRKA